MVPGLIFLGLIASIGGVEGYVRLNRTNYPLSYRIHLAPSMEPPYNYTGELSLALRMNNTQYLALDCADTLRVTVTSLTFDSGFPVNFEASQSGGRLWVKTSVPMRPAYTVQVNLTFEGAIAQNRLDGFYLSRYVYNQTERHLASTQFEAMSARKAYPCFDEPAFRANFTLQITVDSKWKAISNTPIISEEISGSKRTITFAEKPNIPAYLTAWAIYDESSYTGTSLTELPQKCGGSSVVYTTWSNKAYSQEQSQSYFASKAVEQLEDFTGVACRAVKDKMDLLAVPDFNSGAMENWGIITFRETYLLLNPAFSTAADEQLTEMILSHELTHQWFGNLVTPDWWSYTWLSEGFARYLQYIITHQISPQRRLNEQFLATVRQGIMAEDSPTSHPLTNEDIKDEDDVQVMFDSITYDKGASVIHMIRSYLGEVAFQNGINTYLESVDRSGGVTSPDWFFPSFPNLPAEMKLWTETSGYPVIVAEEEQNRLILSQIQIMGWNETRPGSWLVPVSLRVGSEVSWHLLSPNQTLQIDLEQVSEYLINVNQSGYYRVLYKNPIRWRSPRATLLERSALVDDSLMLAYSGLLPFSTAFHAATYHLNATSDFIVWTSGLRDLAKLVAAVEGTDIQANVTEAVLTLVGGAVEYFGFGDKRNKSDPTIALNQMNILKYACEFNHKACLTKAAQLATNINSEAVPEVLNPLLCTSVRTGNSNVWLDVWSRYLGASTPAEKQLFLTASTCTTNTTLLKRLVTSMWGNDVKRQDVLRTLALISLRRPGANEVFSFALNNYTDILNYFNGEARNYRKIISSALPNLDDAHLLQLKQLSTTRPDLKLDPLVKSAEVAMSWRKNVYKQLRHYILGDMSDPDMDQPDLSDKDSSVAILPSTATMCFLILIYFLH